MAEGRGKKGKKAGWQVSLGFKEVIFAGIAALGLMMMSFALGTLAGRGDIYRVLHNWGIVGPEAVKTLPVNQTPIAAPAAPQAAASPEAPPPAVSPSPGALVPPKPPAPSPPKTAAPPPSVAPARKKAKETAAAKEHRTREEEIRRLQKEVARLSRFQNSIEEQKPKSPRPGSKEKAAPALVRVAKFRDGAKAKAKLAEMQKKGEKVTLKEGKDQDGRYFVIYRQVAAKNQEAEKEKKPARGPR
ncbi:MAG: hypothetical protein FJ128_02910 [Deltaproteobacteria bacterium]|nr:hypothetical protein [Deltaproteobacteria bacterium]